MNPTITIVETLQNSLTAATRFNRSDMVAPAAILWTDADAQWVDLVVYLRQLMPELLTLGEYNPDEKTGPAIWLRCVIEGSLPDIKLPKDAIPVVYMPNVSRQTLRAVEECPDSLKPLVELQYRGTVWTQRNGRDWTVEAFLVSKDGGLGFDVAKDRHTRQAMLGALSHLAVTPSLRLTGKRLEAEDFDKLMIEDTPRDLLVWMSSPLQTQKKWDDNIWSAFISRCKAEYGFDPVKDGEIVAGEKLGEKFDDSWKHLWHRYEESPLLYPGIPELLRKSKPSLPLYQDAWPDINEEEERLLRDELLNLSTMNLTDARKKIEDLESEHNKRRDWIWAKIGRSPLAHTLKYLALMTAQTSKSLGGESTEAMAAIYQKNGYQADYGAILALESVKSAEDIRAVESALRSIYLPWLDDTARHFQKLVMDKPLPSASDISLEISADAGVCLLFADGLRFDLSRRLINLVEKRQLKVSDDWHWASLPTVTATAKPSVSPVADYISGMHLGDEFRPITKDNKQPLTINRFRKLLRSIGYQVFGPSEMGDPEQPDAKGWTEFGEIDKLGHSLQGKLASRIADQLDLLIERIQELLQIGWKQVRVITDHGWLLVPGGLPSVKLPKYLTECRWARCAAIKEESKVGIPKAGWHWNSFKQFAYGPGVSCFVKGIEYAHGGVSLQECLIPDLTIRLDDIPTTTSAKISNIHWLGLRCRASLRTEGTGLTAELRTKPNDPDSSVAGPKKIDTDGRVSLLIADETLEGTVISLVIIDLSGSIVGKQNTTIGGDE